MAATPSEVLWTEGSVAVALPRRASPALRPRTRPRHQEQTLRRGLLTIALLCAMGAGVAAGGAAVAQESFAVDRSGAALVQLQAQNRQLEVQLAVRQDPVRIERIATQQLDLHRPAGYVPVTPAVVPPAAQAEPAHGAVDAVPVAAGPAPGGAVNLSQRAWSWLARWWSRLHGQGPR